ncbi:hypothetical protein AAVH_32910, partial [Aphelenchoides avenae]
MNKNYANQGCTSLGTGEVKFPVANVDPIETGEAVLIGGKMRRKAAPAEKRSALVESGVTLALEGPRVR